jgi:hypothetical protein
MEIDEKESLRKAQLSFFDCLPIENKLNEIYIKLLEMEDKE